MAQASQRNMIEPDLPGAATSVVESIEARDRQMAPRDEQLAAARAEFRKERAAEIEQLAAERAELKRLQRQTQDLNREASRNRDRTKRLAIRYSRRIRHKWSAVRLELEAQKAALDESRAQLCAETTRFNTLRSEFHARAAEDKERQREAWAELETQRQRLAAERTEANELVARQEAILATRGAELVQREKAVGGTKAKLDAESAALRQEVAGLENRAAHARSIVEELEKRREELRAEMLALAPKAEATTTPNEFLVPLDRRADRDLTRWTAELDAQDRQLAQEKANLAKLKSSLQQESTNLADDRKVLAEQFALLGAARAEWQEVEGRTVAELEELARSLRLKEEDMAAREDRLVKADARRREEGHDLWRLRLKLEAWQSKLSTVSRLWHSERERREQDLALREKSLALRETALQQAFDQCERSRAEEHERLRTEIRLWADDRIRLKQAAENFDTQAREAMSEIARHAARAMVAEELLSEASSKGKGATRRFEVLRKRWEKVFVQKLNEIDRRRVLIGQELTRLDDRYEEIHRSLTELAERESEFNRKVARIEMTANRVVAHRLPASTENQSDAIAALRDEIERMAHVLLEAGVPEQPDEMLPLAAEEIEEGPEPVMLPFAFHSRAA